ncbi:MAG TPA: hypothetical protein VK996_18200 [Ramlibacter sp.]|nr:hypothetical protein [Ramlibacter sp.]
MTLELPVLRLGLAGFSAGQQDDLATALGAVGAGVVHWEISELDHADAWWVNGARVQELGDNRLRIGAGTPNARALQLHLPDVDRPIAFSQPIETRHFQPLYSFDPESLGSQAAVLRRFEAWLAPTVAQFFLAAHIVEHETALRSGVFDLTHNGSVIAVVSMHGETAVLPTAAPSDFEDAVWGREPAETEIPEHFVRASMSQLMWQYAVRTQHDVLPRHYRTGLLYFRRAPRVAQRVLRDSHLLLLRELARGPATFDMLQQNCGFGEDQLAHDLAALYFVGSITSNPRRAARPPIRIAGSAEADSSADSQHLPSGLDSVPPTARERKQLADHDLTAPAPIGPH